MHVSVWRHVRSVPARVVCGHSVYASANGGTVFWAHVQQRTNNAAHLSEADGGAFGFTHRDTAADVCSFIEAFTCPQRSYFQAFRDTVERSERYPEADPCADDSAFVVSNATADWRSLECPNAAHDLEELLVQCKRRNGPNAFPSVGSPRNEGLQRHGVWTDGDVC